MKLGKLLRGAVKLPKDNPQVAAIGLAVALPIAIKVAPGIVKAAPKVVRVVKALK